MAKITAKQAVPVVVAGLRSRRTCCNRLLERFMLDYNMIVSIITQGIVESVTVCDRREHGCNVISASSM